MALLAGGVCADDRRFEQYRPIVAEALRLGPNFAGHYRVVKIQTGTGPIGVVVADIESGKVYGLPNEAVADGFYIISDMRCVDYYLRFRRGAQMFEAISFSPDSELFIATRCKGTGYWGGPIERRHFRWRGNKWKLLKFESIGLPRSPPPPPPSSGF